MFKILIKRRASSILEYMALSMFILIAFFTVEKYIVRGMTGRMKAVGDTFGQGKQFDTAGTVECFYDYLHCKKGTGIPMKPRSLQKPCVQFNAWIHKACFDTACKRFCNLPKEHSDYPVRCQKCIEDCSTDTSLCD